MKCLSEFVVVHLLATIALPAAIAHATPPADLTIGVGDGPHTKMLFKYEVTFMKFDVANVGAMVPPAVGFALEPYVEGQKFSEARAHEMGEILVECDPVLLSMEFLRDAGLHKFMKGHERNTEAAQKSGFISEEERAAILAGIEQDMAPVRERGVKKGDAVYFRVQGDDVRTVYIGVDGDELLDITRTDPVWTRAYRAGFFCPESKFRDKLIKSLYEPQT
jgi:hypothetical protein